MTYRPNFRLLRCLVKEVSAPKRFFGHFLTISAKKCLRGGSYLKKWLKEVIALYLIYLHTIFQADPMRNKGVSHFLSLQKLFASCQRWLFRLLGQKSAWRSRATWSVISDTFVARYLSDLHAKFQAATMNNKKARHGSKFVSAGFFGHLLTSSAQKCLKESS